MSIYTHAGEIIKRWIKSAAPHSDSRERKTFNRSSGIHQTQSIRLKFGSIFLFSLTNVNKQTKKKTDEWLFFCELFFFSFLLQRKCCGSEDAVAANATGWRDMVSPEDGLPDAPRFQELRFQASQRQVPSKVQRAPPRSPAPLPQGHNLHEKTVRVKWEEELTESSPFPPYSHHLKHNVCGIKTRREHRRCATSPAGNAFSNGKKSSNEPPWSPARNKKYINRKIK